MSLKIQDITTAIAAYFESVQPQAHIDNVSIDSRSLQNNASTLFFALPGQNRDGHYYIPELLNKGVVNFVVTHIPETVSGKANFIIVNNTLQALQDFAAYYRQQFQFPVIGITGSNGKTIVKEWLNYLLSPDYNVIRSPKSYNSQVGVPLSIIGINKKHNLGIFEAGISLPNEMQKLQHIICPDIGILTNIGTAHDESFTSQKEKTLEKLKLFSKVKLLVLQKNEAIEKLLPATTKTFTWSFNNTGNVLVNKLEKASATCLEVIYQDTIFSVEIPFTDDYAIENAINCLMVMLHLGYSHEIITQRLAGLYPVELRLQVKDGINGCTIIDDSYSADYQSLKIALDFLEQQKTHKKKTIILSDIFQSGFTKKELYKKVKELLRTHKIGRVIGIGETITKKLADFPNFFAYKTTQEFLAQYNSNAFEDETILVKGARSFRFEEIVVLLEEKTHETVLEINLNAIVHNLNFYRAKLKPETKVMVMVKAFGYGSGSYEIAKTLSHHKVDYLGVAFADEGIALRNAGTMIPIVVMNPESSAFNAMTAYNLEPEIYSLRELKAFIDLARKKNLWNYPIHLKLDTGMHRLGFEEHQLAELIALLRNNNFVSVKSIFSHLSASDSLQFKDFTTQQIDLFEKWSTQLIDALQINPMRHILNTSGIYNYPNAQYNMVRLGIGLYGVGNDPTEMKHLQNVGTLKTVILQIKEIEVGESVGYSRKYIATQKTRTATLPIGYADGIPRAWGNGNGYVMINSQKASIVGNICMDMLMVDVTNIDCKEGDRVIVFGKDPSVVTIANTLNTIAYEILAGISHRVKRIFYKE
ncbi:bifunctional UDP-N-acetylmuramoyl-tripeptide:D-alanyl-D-alanine ligase/alanine racemase [Flavobacterium arcticum]|uniref:Alanine racemase n=1 Tax=Flavobacterium arcticum TaxID=1784713 RepID=A0A345HAJ5_9FLAO|nr:bifunctional UDP-N-acetylmuramoyl-tripeptide:D-alanyl-D-alanine ligase/alanine racemase [Flavobacterium arcticum]AXG73605.1 bifunctional UDP-N-acetylmuramoyl-tripeptide:D-alanyl-D-alanine ligase/alanine racemase [Flavobacterium arcticum]KAF2506416.1 bifunctional UDP-N-acetylmuramoyl-tripeptide:D-alanyl-D-alanine ligase/alanine racemase [Flavobacterium arcticum]